MSGQVRDHHLFDHFAERVTRFPTEHSTRFRRIANQQVNLRRPVIPLINFHELAIVEPDFYARDGARDLARDKLKSAPRALMVEHNPADAIKTIRLTIVPG